MRNRKIQLKRLRLGVGYVIMAVWALAGLALGAATTALHMPFKAPTQNSAAPVATENDSSAEERTLSAIHFISEGCGCSAAVAKHLIERGRLKDLVSEHVVLIGTPEVSAGQFQELGFTVESITGAELFTRFGLETAPLMKVSQSDGTTAYLGGYYNSMARTKNLDTEIIHLIKSGQPPKPYPSYGCAQSEALQAAQDPFGLKYDRQKKPDHHKHAEGR